MEEKSKKPYTLTVRVDEKLYRDLLVVHERDGILLRDKSISHMIRVALRMFLDVYAPVGKGVNL